MIAKVAPTHYLSRSGVLLTLVYGSDELLGIKILLLSVPTTIAWQWFGDQYARGMVDRYRQGVLGVLTDGRPRTASMIRRAFWGTPANEVLGKILWQLESSGYIESEMKNARPATHPEDVVEREFYTITPVGRELLTGHRRKATT